MIFNPPMASKTMQSSLPIVGGALVRVSKLAAVASIVRSSPCPSLSQPLGASIASVRSWCPTATRGAPSSRRTGKTC